MNLVGFEEDVLKDNRLYIVNPNTNKVENYINKGDKIVRKSSIDAFRDIKEQEAIEQGCDKWKMKEFYKTNIEEMKLVLKELSQSEKAFLASITPYISFDSNLLQVGSGRKAKDIGTEELVDITGMSRSTVYDTIDTLRKKDIVYRGENSRNRQYYINPWLYCKGNRINRVLKDMFKNYKVRSQGNVLWKDLEGF